MAKYSLSSPFVLYRQLRSCSGTRSNVFSQYQLPWPYLHDLVLLEAEAKETVEFPYNQLKVLVKISMVNK